MKVCVTSQGNSLDSQVDPRFGRCPYFLIVDTDSFEFEAIENSSVKVGGGAGIVSGQLIASKGAEMVITGNVGPNAFQTLQAANIKIIIGASGTVKQAIENFKKGQLKPTDGPSVGSKFGMPGGGTGRGGGRNR